MRPFDPPSGSPSSLLDLMGAMAWGPPYLPPYQTRPLVSEASPGNQWQPNSQATAIPTNPQVLGLGAWPMPQAFTNPMSPGTILAHSDQAPARPGWAPWSPTDVFKPWLDGAIDSLDKTIRHFRSGSGQVEDERNSPDCREEWRDALEQCAKWLSTRNPPRGVTGGYKTIDECARGLVSERCGGNPYERPRGR
jgi:hypothetical protein